MSVHVQSQCLGARFRTWRHYASEMRKSPQRVGVFSPQASFSSSLHHGDAMPVTRHVEPHCTAGTTVHDIVIGMSDGLTVPFALAAGLSGAVESTSIADRSRGRPRRVRGLWNCARHFLTSPTSFPAMARHQYGCLGQSWLTHCLGIETARVVKPGGCPRTNTLETS
jgi:hypothetical protein